MITSKGRTCTPQRLFYVVLEVLKMVAFVKGVRRVSGTYEGNKFEV